MQNTKRRGVALALTAALAFTLAACGSANEPQAPAADPTGEAAATGASAPEDAKPITIGLFNWEEAIAASYLWKNILTDAGYEVNLETADPAVIFAGTASGEYDVNFDTWLPLTHADYKKRFGDDMEELGMWLEDAPLTVAVNEDAPITSLAELADNADAFGNRIVGIEAGAGLTKQLNESAIPTYGLQNMDFVTSSTPAMLAELRSAIDNGDNIAVTLWRPHWAYDEFPIRDLEDPEGAMGQPDDIYAYGTAGFSEEYPQVAEWIGKFKMTHESIAELENVMFNEFEGSDNEAAVAQWVADNPDFVKGITG